MSSNAIGGSYFIVLQHRPGKLPRMKTWFAAIRPEERRRREYEGPGWADTAPAWFRSEAFAEDLLEPVNAQATSPPPVRPCIRPPGCEQLPASMVTAD